MRSGANKYHDGCPLTFCCAENDICADAAAGWALGCAGMGADAGTCVCCIGVEAGAGAEARCCIPIPIAGAGVDATAACCCGSSIGTCCILPKNGRYVLDSRDHSLVGVVYKLNDEQILHLCKLLGSATERGT